MPVGRLKRGRRGQITVFFIIGIIILLTAGIVFYLKEIGLGDYKILQPKSAPVENYIETCMERVGRDALDLVGSQGGFANFPTEIRYDPTRYVFVTPLIPGTQDFAPRVPLWWHNGVIKKPSQILTESEVDAYIEENIGFCLNNLNQFREEFDFEQRDFLTSFTTFNNKDVTIILNWELDIIHKGSQKITRKNKFIVDLDVQFLRLMEAAEKIMNHSVNTLFFDEITFNLMASMPEDQPDGLPLTGMMFQCGALHWDMYAIEDNLQDALRPVIGGVRFEHTNYVPFLGKEREYERVRGSLENLDIIGDEELESQSSEEIILRSIGGNPPPPDAYEYFQLFLQDWTEDKRRYKDLVAGAEYRNDFGMDFLAKPSRNGRMTSNVADFRHEIMSLICLNYYHFVYNVRFPIVITIKDPEAYNGKGAAFKFATLVTIANNEPDKQPRPAEFFEPEDVSPEFCDPLNRFGKQVRIIAVDKNTGLEINKVNMSYRCFNSYCSLGQTKSNNYEYVLDTQLPQGCSRGILTAEKEGYQSTKEQYLGEEPHFISMYPIINLSYQVVKRRDQSIDTWHFLEANEHVSIQLETIGNTGPPFNYFSDYSRGNTYNLTDSIELPRADDVTYKLSMYLFKTNPNGEDIPVGGWEGNWTPDLADLFDTGKLTFEVIEKFPPANSLDPAAMGEVFNLIQNRSAYPNVKPSVIPLAPQEAQT